MRHYAKIIVCSCAKTGSSTLVRSLSEYCKGSDTIVLGRGMRERHTRYLADHEMAGATVQSRILIVTSFREPVGRIVAPAFPHFRFND